jgi:predicted aspartyl protease
VKTLKHTLLLLLLLSLPCAASAQKRLRVLKATQNKLSIREGQSFYKNAWNVSNTVKPDIFISQHLKGKERIVFYSDIDSIAFWVKPQRTYDFVVVVNGRDSAYTRISTYPNKRPSLVPKLVFTRVPRRPTGPDTIPFRLDKTFGIHVQGRLNGSEPLDFFFDTGASVLVLTAEAANQKVRLKQDGQAVNTGTGGKRSVPTSSGNVLQVGGLTWRSASLMTIDYHGVKGIDFDGILGWVAFEDKIVELDYEHGYLVIHDKLPMLGPDYSQLEMKLLNGIPFIKCLLTVQGQQQEGWFDLDTGSDGWLVVGQQFAVSTGLTRSLQRRGTAHASGSAGEPVAQAIFSLPTLTLGNYQLYQLPLYVNEQDPVGGAIPENIGTQILKRFNLLLDFSANHLYIKPNKYLYSPTKEFAK